MNKIVIKELPMDTKTSGIMLLVNCEQKETKVGVAYCELTLSDGESQISGNLWNTTKDSMAVQKGELINVEIYPKMYQEHISYDIKRYTQVPEDFVNLSPLDFIIKAPYRAEDMYNEILRIVKMSAGDRNNTLADLCITIYEQNKEQLLYWSAAKTIHHNIYSGLLYHIFRMLRLATTIVKVYPGVDSEVLFCAVALHDIGKLKELQTDSLGCADYSVDGNLFGHTMIGLEMVNQAVLDADDIYDSEKVKELKHCIAAHHGKLELGAIVVPQTEEAFLLHKIDMIDAQVYQFEEAQKNLEPGTMSERIFGLNTRVYKPIEADN